MGDFNEVLHHGEYESITSFTQIQLDDFQETTDICAL